MRTVWPRDEIRKPPPRPANIGCLGALKIEKLERIVIDASHIDVKRRGVMDMKETAMPLIRLLAREEFKQRYVDKGQKLDLVFY